MPVLTRRKVCSVCNRRLPATGEHFVADGRHWTGLAARCRRCVGVIRPKVCRDCKRRLPSTPANFSVDRRTPCGLTARCRDCIKVLPKGGHREADPDGPAFREGVERRIAEMRAAKMAAVGLVGGGDDD